MTETFYFGARIRLSATFTNLAGALFDPSSLTLAIGVGSPGTTPEPHEYPGDIVRDGTGEYHFDWLADILGYVNVQWASTETGVEGYDVPQLFIKPNTSP